MSAPGPASVDGRWLTAVDSPISTSKPCFRLTDLRAAHPRRTPVVTDQRRRFRAAAVRADAQARTAAARRLVQDARRLHQPADPRHPRGRRGRRLGRQPRRRGRLRGDAARRAGAHLRPDGRPRPPRSIASAPTAPTSTVDRRALRRRAGGEQRVDARRRARCRCTRSTGRDAARPGHGRPRAVGAGAGARHACWSRSAAAG